MEDSVGVIEWLVNHRLTREKKVLTNLQKLSAASMDELVAVVYDDVDISLHQMAKLSLQAHLIKLETEGLAAYTGEIQQWKAL